MHVPWLRIRLRRTLTLLGALVALLGLGFVLIPAADHRDGPMFGPPGVNVTISRRDINDVFIFRSPSNRNNTVLIVNFSPFSTATTPGTFDHRITLDINVINRNVVTITDDITLRVSFSAPDSSGRQNVTLRGFPASRFAIPSPTNPNPSNIVAQGRTGRNLPVSGGGMFRAAEQDDPFFFDAAGFAAFLNGAPFPRRPPGTGDNAASNFFGPNVNTLSVMLEVPTNRLTRRGSNLLGVWARMSFQGQQIDRMGRPGINTALIPPVPRGAAFPIGGTADRNRQERRNAFNAGHPRDDRTNFRDDMISVLTNFLGRTAGDAGAISDLLLPDILVYDITNTNGFGQFLTGPGGETLLGNGRRLRDDVIDFELNVLTNGAVTTDNVDDDNGTRITNTFPYIGPRNADPTGVPGTPIPNP